MKDLVLRMAQALVDNPKEVSVEEIVGDYTDIFQLRVAKEDRGKVIGKQGRIADAMRTILFAAGKGKKRSVLEIMEDDPIGKQGSNIEKRSQSNRTSSIKYQKSAELDGENFGRRDRERQSPLHHDVES